MARILEPGEFTMRCDRCETLFAYTYSDVYQNIHDDDDEVVDCPRCERMLNHSRRQRR